MAQCDVHLNTTSYSRGTTPFLLDIQADLLSKLDTRVIVPLIRERQFGRAVEGLHPRFVIEGEVVIMATHMIASIKRDQLGPRVTGLASQRYIIIAAIDVLLSGV